MKWLWFSVKNVRRNRRRSLITILIAAIGTAAMLIGGGFAEYTYASLREATARESGHLVLADHDYFQKEEDVPMQLGLENAAAIKSKLEADAGVRSALSRIQFSGLISNGEKSSVFIGTGVDAAGEFRVRGPFLSVAAGSTLAPQPLDDDLPEVMLGRDLARQLHATPGTTLTLMATTTEGSLNAQDVRVKGIYSVGVPEIDKRAVLVHVRTAQRLLLTDKVSTIAIYLHETSDTDSMRAVVSKLFPNHALQTWRDQAFFYLSVRELYNRIFGLLGAVIVVIVLFAVSNTLGMAVVERTREIGTFRALGALPTQVIRNFVLEGLVVGVLGSALGIVVAVALSLAADFLGIQMPPPPGRSVGYPLHIDLSLALCTTTALVVISASVAAAWAVSRKAAKRSVVEALAHV